ncbi:hypothetical protein CR983_03685, partial [Candidatus Saccharibacteria bacterium]
MTTTEYLALSRLVYQSLDQYVSSSDSSITIGSLIESNLIEGYKDDSGNIAPEYRGLSGLADYTLIAQTPASTPSGFAAMAFQAPPSPDGTPGE